MADEVAPAVEAPVSATPAVEAAAVAPVAETLVVAPEVTPSAEVAPVTEAPVVDAKSAEALPKAEAPASMLAEASDAEPSADSAPVAPEAPTAIPTFEAFTLPEGVSLDAEGNKAFTDILGQFEMDTKADHRLVQDLGQKYMDLYVQQKQADAKSQSDNWVNTRKGWQDEVKNDPIYGRNRHETFMRDAALVRDKFGSDRFNKMIDMTGAGDHPGMMDFVHNVAKFLDRHGLLREGKPVPAPTQKAIPAKQGPRARYTAGSSVQ